MRNLAALAIVAGATIASGGRAEKFTYFETFGLAARSTAAGGTLPATARIQGSFTGDLANGLITNMSDVTAKLNGVSFAGSGSLLVSHFASFSGDIQPGGGVLSLTQPEFNNVVFSSTAASKVGSTQEMFYSYGYPGGLALDGASNARLTGASIGSRLTVRSAQAVPELSVWGMLLVGFAGIGWLARRGRIVLPTAAQG